MHYVCDITATNRSHHSHSIDLITHSLYGITLAICVAPFSLFKTSHPCFMTSSHHFYDATPTIFDIVYTVSVSSHPLLSYITPTEFLRSHPLYMMTSYPMYMTSQPLNVCHHTHFFNGITHFVFRTSHQLCVSYHINCIKHYLHIL